MENFEKCTVAMLGGPCMQHVTGNSSQLNQPQSAIMEFTSKELYYKNFVISSMPVDDLGPLERFTNRN